MTLAPSNHECNSITQPPASKKDVSIINIEIPDISQESVSFLEENTKIKVPNISKIKTDKILRNIEEIQILPDMINEPFSRKENIDRAISSTTCKRENMNLGGSDEKATADRVDDTSAIIVESIAKFPLRGDALGKIRRPTDTDLTPTPLQDVQSNTRKIETLKEEKNGTKLDGIGSDKTNFSSCSDTNTSLDSGIETKRSLSEDDVQPNLDTFEDAAEDGALASQTYEVTLQKEGGSIGLCLEVLRAPQLDILHEITHLLCNCRVCTKY
ncbi:hypothetical protein R5R35_010602 [Gryllus longicercus]|uniref:Uncharacterized protein n=1 Tax=Gryllus longicercus TaxID=2509291 RepID=A0AAN9YXT0_9ORTH